jgi:hypothetical protein
VGEDAGLSHPTTTNAAASRKVADLLITASPSLCLGMSQYTDLICTQVAMSKGSNNIAIDSFEYMRRY